MKYLVSYDLKEGSDYDRVNEHIRNEVDQDAQKILNTQWIVNWDKSAMRLGHEVLRILNRRDSLLVNSLEKEDAASYNLMNGVNYGISLQYPPPTKSKEMNETLDRFRRS